MERIAEMEETDRADGESAGGGEGGKGAHEGAAAERAGALPVVAIVGRPNVGKSTLFNRIVGGRVAIVDDEPGITRDRNYRETHWAGKHFLIVDTGGLLPSSKDKMESLVRRAVETALDEATVVLFIVDAKSGITPMDSEIADLVRRKGKSYVFAVNKTDARGTQGAAGEFYELGLGDFIEFSAEQGINVGNLLDAVTEKLPEAAREVKLAAAIAVVGKPNVGKSSLVNRLTGGETVIVDSEPGTTRDSIDTFIETKFGPLRLVDTAGLRRKTRTSTDLEKYANMRSINAIDRSDVALLMLDPTAGVAGQDLAIAQYIEKTGRGMVLAWNKWDLYAESDMAEYRTLVEKKLRRSSHVPLLFISCRTGRGLEKLIETSFQVRQNLEIRIPTAALNTEIEAAVGRRPPSGRGKRHPKVYYAAQVAGRPPRFTLFVNDPKMFKESYRRYLQKVIRRIYPFEGVPVRLSIRKSK
jgi:GTP-binding protein